jgi:mannan endo-1,4-beta-mannosidase
MGRISGARTPVILSFGAEMNGSWYSWGSGHTRPDVFVAAWRHVVSVFRQAGAHNVRWLWTVNSTNATAAPLKRWWPGNSYVNVAGIDGYYYRRTDTFKSVFGTTIAEIRGFTRTPDPHLRDRDGACGRPLQDQQSFAGVRRYHLLGLVWFDQTQHHGIYHQDWRLEDSPATLAAFRKAENARPTCEYPSATEGCG